MKNVHILSTDKPSRLHEYDYSSLLGLSKEPLQWRLGRNIYITNDDEIKGGDLVTDGKLVGYYSFDEDGCPIIKSSKDDRVYGFGLAPHSKKIILTTDQDLIKDGVQAIDDEFLEWFVKNPKCEEVKTIKVPYFDESGYSHLLIIPKEEPKHKGKELTTEEVMESRSSAYEFLDFDKKETLEEAAERLYPENIESIMDGYHDSNSYQRESFINGYKLAKERSYSEEDIKLAFEAGYKKGFSGYPNTENWKELPFKEWFEQFKNK